MWQNQHIHVLITQQICMWFLKVANLKRRKTFKKEILKKPIKIKINVRNYGML